MTTLPLHSSTEPLVESVPPRPLVCLDSPQSAHVRIDGRDVVMLSSNNYLGLANHPAVVEAAREALERYGAGTSAARSLTGNTPEHVALERELAEFKSAEAAVLFNSGYTANVGTITALTGPDDVIFSDEFNHASIIDGIHLSKSKCSVYPHLDVGALESALKQAGECRQRMIVTDSVFSMEGSIAPLREIVELAERYDAFVMVDEAHATGVFGDHGGGVVEMLGLHGRVAVVLGTLGKALGSIGGYVTGSRALIEHLRRHARSLLFTTSLPAYCAAASRAALRVMISSPQLRRQLWDNTAFFKNELEKLGLNTLGTRSPIVPILVGDHDKAHQMARLLLEQDICTHAIGYPFVPKGRERLRTLVSGAHTVRDLEQASQIIGRLARTLQIIREEQQSRSE